MSPPSPPFVATWDSFNRKPHLVFNLVDDAGWQDWPISAGREGGYVQGQWGDFKYRGTYPRSLMADIEDIFVRDGIQLTRMYSPSVCGPSRRAVFTGRDFQQHGMHNNDCPSVPLNMKLLPSELDRAGYEVGFYGKWHMGFMQEEALPGNKGIRDARVFVRGSVNHAGHHSNGRGSGECTVEPGNGVLADYEIDNQKRFIFDHTVTKDYKDTYNGDGAGYQFLSNGANRPSPRCDTCTEGDDGWNEHATQHLGSYVRDLAIARIMTHNVDNKNKPLALFLAWSGPHTPHTPEGLITSTQVEDAHCAQERQNYQSETCNGDEYFVKNRYARRQFNGSGYTARTGCSPVLENSIYHSHYQAMVAEISLYLGKIKNALVDANMWNDTLMVYQSVKDPHCPPLSTSAIGVTRLASHASQDNGGKPYYNYPMRFAKARAFPQSRPCVEAAAV
jgi:arylsulfatase A-like enzyme